MSSTLSNCRRWSTLDTVSRNASGDLDLSDTAKHHVSTSNKQLQLWFGQIDWNAIDEILNCLPVGININSQNYNEADVMTVRHSTM